MTTRDSEPDKVIGLESGADDYPDGHRFRRRHRTGTHLPHVFERFYKDDASRAAENTGSGLGLSITKAIIERHGGTIRVTEPARADHIHGPAAAVGCDSDLSLKYRDDFGWLFLRNEVAAPA